MPLWAVGLVIVEPGPYLGARLSPMSRCQYSNPTDSGNAFVVVSDLVFFFVFVFGSSKLVPLFAA